MANVADFYTLYMSVNQIKEVTIDSTTFSIALRDSIYDLSPEFVLKIVDKTGLYTATRIGGYGVDWDFRLKLSDKEYAYKCRAERYEMNSFEDSEQGLSGGMEIHMLDSFMYTPSEVKAYKGKSPDKIVKDVVNSSGRDFPKINTEASSNLDMETVYNPGYAPRDFIEKILLPISSSTTDFLPNPYYAFIDAQSTFNYVTLKKLWSQSPIPKVLYYGNRIHIDSSKETKVMYLAPFSHNYTRLDPAIDSVFCRIEDYNGEFQSVDTGMHTFLQKQDLMFYNRDKSIVQNMSGDHFQNADEALREQAGINHRLRKSYLTDKIICSFPLDITYVAGKKVRVDVEYGMGGSVPCEVYSQYYVVESSIHEWDATKDFGTTKLVLGNPVPSAKGTVMAKGLYQG